MEKKAFVVEACKPRDIDVYFPKLVILARDEKEAREILKAQGPQYHIFDRGYGIYYCWPYTISQTRCQLIELPLLDAEKVLA